MKPVTPWEASVVSVKSSLTEDSAVPGVARYLQYEVREGREAGELVVIPKAFIANRNGSFILQLNLFEEE